MQKKISLFSGPVILFDMDGTLTPPRKKLYKPILKELEDLSQFAHIGIVTGSGIDYVIEQCSELWASAKLNPKLILLPCNGTQIYKYNGKELQKGYSCDMKSQLPDGFYQKLIRYILSIQNVASWSEDYLSDFAMSGHFVSYRESLLNWCPIGRDSDDNAREKFKEIDTKTKIRERLLNLLQETIIAAGLESDILDMALGGSTSIDIYPAGWDKTYALKWFDTKEAYFIGDKCEPGGNDYTIFQELSKHGRAYCTSSPKNTMKIIELIKLRLLKEAL